MSGASASWRQELSQQGTELGPDKKGVSLWAGNVHLYSCSRPCKRQGSPVLIRRTEARRKLPVSMQMFNVQVTYCFPQFIK